MQVPQVFNSSMINAGEAFSAQTGCRSLNNMARTIGFAAGYLRRSSSKDIIADMEGLLVQSPKRSVLTAVSAGLLLGTVLRNRR